MHVLLNATSFGYGPASKIAGIAKELVARGASCTFCGDGIALDYIAREKVCSDIVKLDLTEEKSRHELHALSSKFDYALTAMEPDFLKHCTSNLRLGFVDSLVWMWDSSFFKNHPHLLECEHYFIQNTFDARQQAMRHEIHNAFFVGAILNLPSAKRPVQGNRRAVIHYGGVENFVIPLSKIQYPLGMTKVLVSNPDLWSGFSDVIVVSSERTCNVLKRRFARPKWSFQSLSHSEFIELLRETSVLLTSPGLTTMLEAFALNVRTVFLPPQNYSQYLILRKLEAERYLETLMNWPLFFPHFNIGEDTPEEMAVKLIIETIEKFLASSNLIKQFKREIELHLFINENDPPLQIFQRAFVERLGLGGVQEICNYILPPMDAY